MKVFKVILLLLWVGVMPSMADAAASSLKEKGERRKDGASTYRLEAERQAQFYYDFYAGQKAMNDGQYARAFCLFRLCAQINPTDARTQDYLGLIYDALNQADSAKASFARAYQYAPAELYQHHVGTLMDEGKYKEAFAIMKTAVKANEDDADVWHILLQIAMIQEDYATATKAINKVDALLGASPYSALVRYQMALRQKNLKKAFGHLDSYLELVPDNPTILNDYAYLLATHKGDLNKAEKMSAQAIRLQPENSSFLDTYGWILHLKGQDSLAQFYLNKALNLCTDPNERNIILQHIEKAK